MTTLQAPPVVYLSVLLKRPVVDATGSTVGRLSDVIVVLRGAEYPIVTGVVLRTDGRDVFIAATRFTALEPEHIAIDAPPDQSQPFERRDGEVLLRGDVLGHRLIDVGNARLVRAYDIALTRHLDEGWIVTGLDVHRAGLLHLPGRHSTHPPRDWAGFEALIGHQPSALVRAPFGRLRRLKAAQIADLLEDADRDEQTEILNQVHTDPEFEADVFEELDDDQQSRLLANRADSEIAEVLARMRADNAADAILDLPQPRRRPVLDALPAEQRRKVTTLLGYSETTAGGLMGVEYLRMPSTSTVADALNAVREAHTNQPEALVTIYLTDDHDRLYGAISLVAIVQADPAMALGDLADTDPVRVHPTADIIDVVTAMADYNLLTLPVVDTDQHLIGLITVDDVLEAAVPTNWRRREPGQRPAAQLPD